MKYFHETVFSKRFFCFWFIIFLHTTVLNAEILSGFVYHYESFPVAFAFIQNVTKNLMTYSDESGCFDLQGNNEPGDSISISRIGFHSKMVLLGESSYLPVKLIPQNIDLQSVIVEGQNTSTDNQQNELVKIEKSSAAKSISPGKIFNSIPGSYIKSYGGSAGLSSISMDGAPTRHTKILVSGFDITNAQNGQVDLSQLPDNFINSIAYDPYYNSAFESGNSEGSVNILPWKEQNSVYLGIGCYGQQNYGISLNSNRNRIAINLLAGKSNDDGNYKGYNPVTKKNEERVNNHLKREYLSLKMNGVITPSTFIKLLYLYSSQNRGVAGQIWSPTPKSYRDDYVHLLGLKLGWVSKFGAGLLQTTMRNSYDHYFSSPQYGFPYDSEHDVNTIRYKIAQNFNFTNLIKYSGSIQCNDDHLESSDTGNHLRTSWIFSNSLRMIVGKLKFIPAIQHNYSDNLYAENTWNYTVEYSLGWRYFHSLVYNQGIFFHYPTFNDLFWKPGGNPNLKPEETSTKSLDLQFSIFRQKDLKVLLFDKSSENLIQWLPSVSYWQPKNVTESYRRGIKTIYSFSFSKISGFLNYTYNLNEDKAMKKQLLYAPKHSGGLNLDYSNSNWQIHYQVHYSDDRITRYSWPEDIIIDEIIEHTMGVSCDFQFKYGKISNSFLVENLMNEKIETIQGYPEPGRIFKYRLQYYINIKGEMK
ncbi:MAG: TonB-dependent receptor [Candidatus Marinimicrobia bacterium]|nr:TonB-dependent receptor [Candidatus Neomarinimicrobiota bacterium]